MRLLSPLLPGTEYYKIAKRATTKGITTEMKGRQANSLPASMQPTQQKGELSLYAGILVSSICGGFI